MRIQLVRSGGVAGLRLEVRVDVRTLAPEESEALKRLVAAARLEELTPRRVGGPAADRFTYRLRIETDAFEREIVLGEGEVPLQARPLITWLLERARGPR